MSEIITSPSNPRVKEALHLRNRRGRDASERILIDGVREIGRAADAGVAVEEVFFCDKLLDGDDARGLVERLGKQGARRVQVSDGVFDKLRYGDRTGGLVAVARRPGRALAELRLSENSIIAVVEKTEKPGNLGAILRSADGAGVDAVIAVDPVCDIYGPNVIRSSTGIVFSLPVAESDISQAIQWLQSERFEVVAASPGAERVYTELDLSKRVAFVFGGEAQGLTRAWKEDRIARARVPMLGKADSLNVATTAALFFYEARRQRGVIK